MWPPLQFVNDVRKHWGILVTSGAAIGALGIWQSTGHFVRAIMQDVSFWLDIVNNKWGSAPEAVKLLPDDWSTIIYQAGKISPELRRQVEAVGSSLTQANFLITQFLSISPTFRDLGLLHQGCRHLSEAAPGLSRVIAEFEAFESSH